MTRPTKFSDEATLKVLAAALMCGPKIFNGYSDPPDPLDDLYSQMPEPERPSSSEMRDMGYFDAVFEHEDDTFPTWWTVSEKGLQVLKNGGK
jgi:hypothetical protein